MCGSMHIFMLWQFGGPIFVILPVQTNRQALVLKFKLWIMKSVEGFCVSIWLANS